MVGEPSSMILSVKQVGRSVPGLSRYLYGPGKANEHTDQHMVAGSLHLAAAYPGALDPADAGQLGRLVERAWSEQLAVVKAAAPGRSAAALDEGDQHHPDEPHSYQMIVSLPPGAAWTDEQWAVIAHDVVQGMGFSSGPDDEAGCRWFAMRHGQSENGNEHMHIAVSLVRQDGHRADIRGDWPRSQEVRRSIEARRDFVLPLHERGQKVGLPGFTMAEHQIAKKNAAERGHELPDRVRLQHAVRAAAATSSTEAEWFTAVAASLPGAQIEAARRSQAGDVIGYRVRLEGGAWFTGTQLARDLTLQQLRPGWEPNETTQTRDEARQLWAKDAEPVVAADPVDVDQVLQRSADQFEGWRTRIETIPGEDRAGWKRELGELAGAVSVLSGSDGQMTEGMTWAEGFTVAGQGVTRAYLSAPQSPRDGFVRSAPAGSVARNLQLALRASSPNGHRGWLAVMQQINRLARAMRDAQHARGELVAVRQLHDLVTVSENARLALGDDRANVHADRFAYDPELAETVRRRESLNLGGPRPTISGQVPQATPGISPASGADRGQGPRRGR